METDQNERVKWSRRGLAVMAPLLMNAFPFCRKEAVRKSLSLMGDLLDDGWSVLIYPEGTRSITGEIAPFRPGIGLIAGEMLAPVVPVKLRGLFEILPKGKSIPRRGTAQVIFGAPVAFEGEHDHARIAAGIEDALRAL
jgi:long-chain acyl-CoA synthetase